MPWFKSLSDAAAAIDHSCSTEAACDEIAKHVPQSFGLDELVNGVKGTLKTAEPKETAKTRQHLLATLACLRCGNRIRETPTDQTAAQELARLIAQTTAPVVAVDSGTGNDDSDLPAVFNEDLKRARDQLVEHCRSVSNLGMQALEALTKQTSSARLDDEEVLLTLVAFTDESQEWSDPETAAIASTILKQLFSSSGPTKEQFITETVLQRYLRPLFSKSKPSSVTASGRKAAYTDSLDTRGQSIPDDSAQTKPWKYIDLRAVPAVAWAVSEADNQLIAKHWPLFIPVLLTLADDSSTPIRRRGLLILTDFLSKFPDKTLQDTGLAQVFEDAIFPTLAFLPSLTPADESVQLLVPAYGALLSLANKQPAVRKDDCIPNGPKNRLLDKMLREGVLMAYFHAREHVRIVDVLCRQTATILNQMGIHAVKHLKDVVPMLSAIMTEPFATAAPDTLLSAVRALQAVLANCWPRIPASPWQDEIINALVLCWLHLADHDRPDPSLNLLEQELLTSAKVLAAVLKTGEINLTEHVAPLVTKEPASGRLFSR
ncbi:hypothetical protein VTK56DRAFT_204 [Thermocarpiscus australiensis]